MTGSVSSGGPNSVVDPTLNSQIDVDKSEGTGHTTKVQTESDLLVQADSGEDKKVGDKISNKPTNLENADLTKTSSNEDVTKPNLWFGQSNTAAYNELLRELQSIFMKQGFTQAQASVKAISLAYEISQTLAQLEINTASIESGKELAQAIGNLSQAGIAIGGALAKFVISRGSAMKAYKNEEKKQSDNCDRLHDKVKDAEKPINKIDEKIASDPELQKLNDKFGDTDTMAKVRDTNGDVIQDAKVPKEIPDNQIGNHNPNKVKEYNDLVKERNGYEEKHKVAEDNYGSACAELQGFQGGKADFIAMRTVKYSETNGVDAGIKALENLSQATTGFVSSALTMEAGLSKAKSQQFQGYQQSLNRMQEGLDRDAKAAQDGFDMTINTQNKVNDEASKLLLSG